MNPPPPFLYRGDRVRLGRVHQLEADGGGSRQSRPAVTLCGRELTRRRRRRPDFGSTGPWGDFVVVPRDTPLTCETCRKRLERERARAVFP